MSLIECVPNVSEGRRPEVVACLAEALTATAGVRLLDYSADAAHNRSVFTIVGDAEALAAAVLALFARALPLVDLRHHTGEHPRIGAVDVVPFIPLAATPMAACVALARDVGRRVAEQFGVPVFLYEHAASTPARQRLERIRRGGFEGLAAKLQEPEWAPDFGPRVPHPTAGASVVGARGPLIAFNVDLDTDRLDIATAIAKTVRESSGGLPSVKALGVRLPHRGIVQVTTNLTNYRVTPLPTLFAAVAREAARHGVGVLRSELIGLLPADALAGTTPAALRLDGFREDRILEYRLAHA